MAEPASPLRFHCVDDGVPDTTTGVLQDACHQRNVAYVRVDPRAFDYEDHRQLKPGDLLYRPAIATSAIRVEQFLYGPGVATFYRDVDGIYFIPTVATLLFQRAGLPIPRTYLVNGVGRPQLDDWVARLGGYPVVVKLMGYSRGLGVMRADSPESLYSIVEFASGDGKTPYLCAYVEHALHWRLIVVGNRVVAGYRNRNDHNDFRTYADTGNKEDFTQAIRPEMANLAIKAVQVLRYEMGGVDVLEHPTGRLYLLESNFPCYFATPQEAVGTDVAGAMLDFLIEKSRRLASLDGS